MRLYTEAIKINETKTQSHRKMNVLILSTDEKREFFRFVNQELIEYDLTKYKGAQVSLTTEEKEITNQFIQQGK